MNIPFILPCHKDWAKVKFEFPENMKITDLIFYEKDGATLVDIPLYVVDSNCQDLIGNHTIWTRCDRGSVSALYNLFENILICRIEYLD